jgi:hypothetical protein
VPVHEIPPFVVWGSSHFSTSVLMACLTEVRRAPTFKGHHLLFVSFVLTYGQ